MASLTATSLEIRRATDDDDDAVLELLRVSMGWMPDEQHAHFFRWKHCENPHGRSLAWIAVDETGRVVGFRTFMRWRFVQGPVEVAAVRAVDTATHPDHRGRGLFSRLTRHGLDSLSNQDSELVFNTPNQRSLPGYLKLGWQVVGRLPVAARPRSPFSLARLARARTPAGKWSVASRAGLPATEVLASSATDGLLRRLAEEDDRPGSGGPGQAAVLRTALTAEHLRWRYGFPPLHYRAVTLSDDPAEGFALFRVRRRGPTTEAAICEMLIPAANTSSPSSHRRLISRIIHETGADHAVLLGRARPSRGTLPVPGHGPTLVCRPVRHASGRPAPTAWDLTLGDIELF